MYFSTIGIEKRIEMSAEATVDTGRPKVSWKRALGFLVLAFVFAVIVTAGGSLYLPQGPAKVDQIAIPIIVFPGVWIARGIALFVAKHRRRVWLIVGGLTAAHVVTITVHMLR